MIQNFAKLLTESCVCMDSLNFIQQNFVPYHTIQLTEKPFFWDNSLTEYCEKIPKILYV